MCGPYPARTALDVLCTASMWISVSLSALALDEWGQGWNDKVVGQQGF